VKKNNLITKNYIKHNYINKKKIIKLSKNFTKIIEKVKNDIQDQEKTLNVLSKNYNFNFKIKDLQKFKKFKIVVVIGMGGSILGAEAINTFFEEKIKKKFYFFDDLRSKKILDLKKKENLKKILFLVISKSGNTIETLSNFFSLNVIKKNSKNIVIISEKNNNLLFSLTKKFNLFYIEHKKNIGGRYSVLSEVGIVPAYLMGINIQKLRSEIQTHLKGKKFFFLKKSTIKLASFLISKKINNLIFLNYSSRLEKLLFWSQQLIAESLGKNGKGFLPMVSKVPRDHHSLLQNYLDGPKDKLFHIFSIEDESTEKININKKGSFRTFLDKKKLRDIKFAQKNSLIKAFKKKNIPFREFKIKNTNEKTLGELFSYFILETVIIGKLIKVNPFDQPAVEQVKNYTKKLLN
jgi:glucose-6-phosphate isomerase